MQNKILEYFLQKPEFILDWRKKDINILDDMRVSQFLFWKWTNPLSPQQHTPTMTNQANSYVRFNFIGYMYII